MRRVVVTGLGMVSSLGSQWQTIKDNLAEQRTGIQYQTDWDKYGDLNTRLAAPVEDFETPSHYTRKQRRSMGRVALMATRASEVALENAGLLGEEHIKDGRMGVSYGSCSGDTLALADFGEMLINQRSGNLNANTFLRMMGHTTAVNIGVFFGLTGRIIPTSSACTSGSQGIGYAFEAIRNGEQTLMLAGGAEGLCATQAAVFDTLFATSTKNDTPESTPRPFDGGRDGLVIGEGAATLVLEDLEHAQARGADIHAELLGYGTNSDGLHVTQPNAATMQKALHAALDTAGLKPEQIAYVSAHGTATAQGDVAESVTTQGVLGADTPISALKSYTGHTLGACGALEAAVAIHMMNEGWFHGTANLDSVDSECAALDYLTGTGRKIDAPYIMSNNFAFGGINTSLIFGRSIN